MTVSIAGVIVPAMQYAVYNKSFSLQCYSSFTVESQVWMDSQNVVHNGSFNPVSLQDEGQYTCHLDIMGKIKTMGAQLFVIGKQIDNCRRGYSCSGRGFACSIEP